MQPIFLSAERQLQYTQSNTTLSVNTTALTNVCSPTHQQRSGPTTYIMLGRLFGLDLLASNSTG